MRIKNHTQWDTKQLKRIILRVIAGETRIDKKRTLIVVHPSRTHVSSWIGGADRGARVQHLFLPPQILATWGVHKGSWGSWLDQQIAGLQLEWREKPKAPRLVGTALAQKRLAHAEGMVKKWETKVKRAQTGLKTWRRKVRYYQKRIS